jgi:hypothetical protein
MLGEDDERMARYTFIARGCNRIASRYIELEVSRVSIVDRYSCPSANEQSARTVNWRRLVASRNLGTYAER